MENRPENLSSIPEVKAETDHEKKIVPTTEGEYRKIEMTCPQCSKEFTRSIPLNWFDKNGGINKHELSRIDVSLETAKDLMENNACAQHRLSKKESDNSQDQSDDK